MRDSSTSLDLNVIHKTMRMLVGGVVFLHHGQWSASLPFLDPFLAFCRIVQVRSNGNPNFSSLAQEQEPTSVKTLWLYLITSMNPR